MLSAAIQTLLGFTLSLLTGLASSLARFRRRPAASTGQSNPAPSGIIVPGGVRQAAVEAAKQAAPAAAPKRNLLMWLAGEAFALGVMALMGGESWVALAGTVGVILCAVFIARGE